MGEIMLSNKYEVLKIIFNDNMNINADDILFYF